jgi:hypothetical protein
MSAYISFILYLMECMSSIVNNLNVFCSVFAEYSSNRTEPDLASSSYLKTIGEKLHPKIDILWTGEQHFAFSHFYQWQWGWMLLSY